MTYTNAIILGIVQGLAEFLPISSSGHLALLQHFFHVETDKVLMFTVLLHIGTLLSVFIMYWKDIWELIKEFFITIADLVRGRGLRLQERPVRKLGVMIIVATIPTALMGFLLNDFFESLNSILWAIGIGWIFTGFILYFSEKMGRANRDLKHMNFSRPGGTGGDESNYGGTGGRAAYRWDDRLCSLRNSGHQADDKGSHSAETEIFFVLCMGTWSADGGVRPLSSVPSMILQG